MADLKKPDSKFFIKINGEEQAIKMTFALQQEIMKVIPSAESIAELLISDFYLREYVARRVLTGNKRVTDDADLVDLFDLEFEDEALDDMLLWVTEHVLYFFMKTVVESMKMGTAYQEKIKALTPSSPSQTGSSH